ncbi:protein of unknown function [Methylocaldum szegediense]|uniref:Uncharacterized protein n=1 Tax=Methylocaldum szegediense TaxID=73780 RepID=A0ABM9I173_9GAMM|nr:protein of unknown function [Methylocaldum szegediense]
MLGLLTVSIHSRLLSRELPSGVDYARMVEDGFNPLPVIKPGVTSEKLPLIAAHISFNPLPVIKPGVTGSQRHKRHALPCFNPLPVIKPGVTSALASGAKGRTFESSRARQISAKTPCVTRVYKNNR